MALRLLLRPSEYGITDISKTCAPFSLHSYRLLETESYCGSKKITTAHGKKYITSLYHTNSKYLPSLRLSFLPSLEKFVLHVAYAMAETLAKFVVPC